MTSPAPSTGPSSTPKLANVLKMNETEYINTLSEDIRMDPSNINRIWSDMAPENHDELRKLHSKWRTLDGHSFYRYREKWESARKRQDISKQIGLNKPHRNPAVPVEEMQKIREAREDMFLFLLEEPVKNESLLEEPVKNESLEGLASSDELLGIDEQVIKAIEGLDKIKQKILDGKDNPDEKIELGKHDYNYIHNVALPALEGALGPAGMDEANPETEKYLQKWIHTAHLMDRVDPLRSAEWHKANDEKPGFLDTPARLGLGIAAAVLATASILILIKKYRNGEEITMTDIALTAAYTAGAAVAFGFCPNGKETQLAQREEIEMYLNQKSLAPFHGLFDKTISRDQGADAAQNLHDALADMNNSEKKKFENAIPKGNILGYIEEEGFADKNSDLYKALQKLETHQQKKLFLETLLALNIESKKKVDSIMWGIRRINVS